MDSFTRLLDTHGMLPHGFCLLWQPGLLALHVISDLVIAAAYISIPLAILAFVRRRTDLIAEHKRIAILFVLFILGCGLTHVMGIVVLWRPAYWTDGVIKGITATVSLITAIALWPVVPRLLAIPSPGQLADANASLMAEVAARRTALEELGAVRENLEAEIQRRTAEVQTLARRFQIATEGSVVTLFEQDEALRFTWLHTDGLHANLRMAERIALDAKAAHGCLVAIVAVQAQEITFGAIRLGDRTIDGHAGSDQITWATIARAVAA